MNLLRTPGFRDGKLSDTKAARALAVLATAAGLTFGLAPSASAAKKTPKSVAAVEHKLNVKSQSQAHRFAQQILNIPGITTETDHITDSTGSCDQTTVYSKDYQSGDQSLPGYLFSIISPSTNTQPSYDGGPGADINNIESLGIEADEPSGWTQLSFYRTKSSVGPNWTYSEDAYPYNGAESFVEARVRPVLPHEARLTPQRYHLAATHAGAIIQAASVNAVFDGIHPAFPQPAGTKHYFQQFSC